MKKTRSAKHQKGAVAIEFAALFTIFFVVLHAIIAYSLPLLLLVTFKELSAQAARTAIRVVPDSDLASYTRLVNQEVSRIIDASWLPSNWVSGNCPAPQAEGLSWQALDNGFGHFALDPEQADRPVLHVCLQRYYIPGGQGDRAAIIPGYNLLGIQIPKLPVDENGDPVVRAHTILRN